MGVMAAGVVTVGENALRQSISDAVGCMLCVFLRNKRAALNVAKASFKVLSNFS